MEVKDPAKDVTQQDEMAAGHPDHEVGWGNSETDTKPQALATPSQDMGGSHNDDMVLPDMLSHEINWPWGEEGCPADRASPNAEGAKRDRSPSRNPQRENVNLKPDSVACNTAGAAAYAGRPQNVREYNSERHAENSEESELVAFGIAFSLLL